MEVSAETVRSSTVAQRPSAAPVSTKLLQRKCACGGTAPGGECDSCKQQGVLQRQAKDSSGPAAGTVIEHGFGHDFSRIPVHPPTAGAIQTRLTVNEPGDVYEREADRVADQVLASPAHPAVSGAPPNIQRFSGQSNGHMDAVPTSVNQAIASPGRPLEATLRQDMEQRFGHDFSRVRVHTDGKAADSAHAVSARAYTVGHDIVFAAGQYDSGANEGRKLIAHELTHTIQQSVSASAASRNGMALQRQGVPGSKPAKAEESGGESLFTIFVADEKKKTDKAFARRQAEEDAARIRKSGTLSRDDRQLVNAKLRFFEGAAWQTYSQAIKPALVEVTQEEIQMPGEDAAASGAAKPAQPGDLTEQFNKIRAFPTYIDNNIVEVNYFTAELARIHYKDGSTYDLGLVPKWMKPPVVEVDYHTPAEQIRKVEDVATGNFGFMIEGEIATAARTMPYKDLLKTFTHPIDLYVEGGTGRVIPSRINMLTAPTLCGVLRDSERRFEEQVDFAVKLALGGIEAIGAYAGQGGIPKAPGGSIASVGTRVASRALSPTARTLAREMDALLAKGGTKTLSVEGVELADVAVGWKGSVLAVRRFMSKLPEALRGKGTGTRVTAAFEDAAVEIGRLNGAKTVTIDVGIIINPGWRELLEARGYVHILEDGAWVKTIKL